MDWKRTDSETAAVLLIDSVGAGRIECLPGRTRATLPLPELGMRRVLGVGWKQGLVVAGVAGQSTDDELVLIAAGERPRALAKGVRSARLSPDATALAYEIAPPRREGSGERTSYVFEIGTGKLTALGRVRDPLWEADSRHLRATKLRDDGEHGQRSSLRVRWDRGSGSTTIEGPGSAQLPAPLGSNVAWTEEQPSSSQPDWCAVFLSPRGGVRHSVVGSFCAGIADDRGVRWSPDGRWLAFPHPAPGPDGAGKVFVDVVSAAGGRYPALSALAARSPPDRLYFAHGISMWFDWSPSARFLAFDNGAGQLDIYDFEAHGMTSLGKGARPTWSPGGAYLLVVENGAATVLSGSGRADRIGLGAIQDAVWLPAQACQP